MFLMACAYGSLPIAIGMRGAGVCPANMPDTPRPSPPHPPLTNGGVRQYFTLKLRHLTLKILILQRENKVLQIPGRGQRFCVGG